MKTIKTITITALSFLSLGFFANTSASNPTQNEQFEQLHAKIEQLETENKQLKAGFFPEASELSDDIPDYYAALEIVKAYNDLEYDKNVKWKINENGTSMNVNFENVENY